MKRSIVDIESSVGSGGARGINVGGMIAVCFYICYILGVYKVDLLFGMQELSIFLPGKDFFLESLALPGGFLLYMGDFFLQFCYEPWLGAFLLVVLFFLLQFLVCRVMNIPSDCRLLALIPSLLFLLLIARLDYRMYILRDSGMIYSQLLGGIFSVAVLGGYKACQKLWSRILYISLVLLTGYPLIGFYSLFAVGLMIFSDVSVSVRRNWAVAGWAVLFGLLLPVGCVLLFYERVDLSSAYLMGLPLEIGEKGGRFCHILFLILLSLVLLLFLSPAYEAAGRWAKRAVFLSSGIIIGLLWASWHFTYKDVNFHAQLKMERAMEREDWQKVLAVASETPRPTRILIMYRNIALYRTGRLCDGMFTYPDGSEPLNIPLGLKMTGISAPRIYYYFGRLNFCYRWAMEQLVQQGVSAGSLKWLARVAVFNRECELARKYLGLLKKAWFHRSWAEKYESYLEHAESLKNNSDYKPIYALQQYETTLWEDNSVVESNILNHYANLESGTSGMLELSMASILITKSVAAFWKKFPVYVSQLKGKKIPVHVLEAALLYAGLEKNEPLKQEIIALAGTSSPVVARFGEFMQLVETLNGETDEQGVTLFRQRFGDTFWFYYFFVNDIKTD